MDRGSWQAIVDGSAKVGYDWVTFTFKRKNEKEKNNNNSLANSRIFGSKGQLLFGTVLISGEDQIFYSSSIGFLLSFSIKGQNWKSILCIYEN